MVKDVIVDGVNVSNCEHFELGENGSSKICKNIYCKDECCTYNNCLYKDFQMLKQQPDFYKKLAFDLADINKTLESKYEELKTDVKKIISTSDTCQIPFDKKKMILYLIDKLVNGEKLYTTCTGNCDRKRENTKLSCSGCIAHEIKKIIEEF